MSRVRPLIRSGGDICPFALDKGPFWVYIIGERRQEMEKLICPRCGAEVKEMDRGWCYCKACDTWTKTSWCRKQAEYGKAQSCSK